MRKTALLCAVLSFVCVLFFLFLVGLFNPLCFVLLYLRGRLCALSLLCQRIEDYGKHVLVF